jgi:hypothetical protein
MSISVIHGYAVGSLVIGAWAIIAGWALALRFTDYDETPTFWKAVSAAQILLGIQLLFGLVLLAIGRRPGADGWFDTLFHPLYGFVFPIIVLVLAHAQARAGNRNAYATFALAAFVIFALTVRALMVGAGSG